jgi:hypothetical protein
MRKCNEMKISDSTFMVLMVPYKRYTIVMWTTEVSVNFNVLVLNNSPLERAESAIIVQ